MNPATDESLSWEHVVEIVEKDLAREFEGTKSPEAIETVARESVRSFVTPDVRIRAFVAVLASKAARRRLRDSG